MYTAIRFLVFCSESVASYFCSIAGIRKGYDFLSPGCLLSSWLVAGDLVSYSTAMTRCISYQWQWTLHLATAKDVKGNLVTKAFWACFFLAAWGGASSAVENRMGGFPQKLCDMMDGCDSPFLTEETWAVGIFINVPAFKTQYRSWIWVWHG